MDEQIKKSNMIWYKFFYSIKLPISIAFSIIAYAYVSYAKLYLLNQKDLSITWLLYMSVPILYTVLLYKMYYKEKDTCFYFIISLIIDILLVLSICKYFSIINNIINFFIIVFMLFVWFLPNYVYINKRIDVFQKNNKENYKNEI